MSPISPCASSILQAPIPLLSALVFALMLVPAVNAIDWLPISTEDRVATASTIDPDAGAEILYRLEEIDDSEWGEASTDEYIRIKVYNEKGVQWLDKRNIEYNDNERIRTLEARVIKPDGTIINVPKTAFYDRQIIKTGDVKVRVRSFSFPSLEPGVIVEYKWRKTSDENIFGMKLMFLQDMPTRHVIFRIKPLPLFDGWRTEGFFHRCDVQKLQLSKDGFNYIEMRNLPAFVEEPNMPPDNDVQPWMLFYPRDKSQGDNAKYWINLGKRIGGEVERYAKKPSKLVESTAASLTSGATTDDEKLMRINEYCRREILNIWHYTPRGTYDEKIRKKENRSPDDLIKTKLGSCDDIPVLFIALARSLGIDARMALCSNRMDGRFKKDLPREYYLRERAVAIKSGEGWRFYDPAHRLINNGALHRSNEGAPALVILPKTSDWVVTPVTPAKESVRKRSAKLRLNDEGTLLGDVRIEYYGQNEIEARSIYHLETAQKIEEIVSDGVKGRMPTAEVTDVSVPNADEYLKPLVVTYSVKIPNYAERVGQRFFIQPGFFTKGEDAQFTADTRKHDIYFKFPWSVEDDLTITLPAGFSIEEGSSPPAPGKTSWGAYDITLAFKKSTNEIIYKRKLVFEPTMIQADGYAGLKRVFDFIHAHDAHALTLRVGK